MKKLPVYAKTLLLKGASTLGKFTEGFYYVEESIKCKDFEILLKFCEWIDENVGGASSYNIDMLFSSFRNPNDKELAKQVTELSALIKMHKI